MPDLLEEAKRLSEIKARRHRWAWEATEDIEWLVERLEQERAENERLRKAADALLGCIVEAPDGELELVLDSNKEVEALRALAAQQRERES